MGATSPTVSHVGVYNPRTHDQPYSHSHHSAGASATSPAIARTCTLVYSMARTYDHSYSPSHSLSPFRLQPHGSHMHLRARRSRPHSFVRWRECHVTSHHSHLHSGVDNGPHLRSLIFAFALTITFPIAASQFSHALACTTLMPTRSFTFARSLFVRSRSICHVITATRSHVSPTSRSHG